MTNIKCPKCGKEMEKVIGFPGYVWCRDCHITKKIIESDTNERGDSQPLDEEKK